MHGVGCLMPFSTARGLDFVLLHVMFVMDFFLCFEFEIFWSVKKSYLIPLKLAFFGDKPQKIVFLWSA